MKEHYSMNISDIERADVKVLEPYKPIVGAFQNLNERSGSH